MDDVQRQFFIYVDTMLNRIYYRRLRTYENLAKNAVVIVFTVDGERDTVCGGWVVEKLYVQTADFRRVDEMYRNLVAALLLKGDDIADDWRHNFSVYDKILLSVEYSYLHKDVNLIISRYYGSTNKIFTLHKNR